MSSEHVEVLERLRGVLEHGKMGDKCLIAPDLVTAAIAALSAQQPAADGGFTAADMMDARQEGRKEAQQPAACVGCEGKPSPENTPCAVCGQQPATVDAEIEALRAEREVIGAEAVKYAGKSGRLEAKVERLAEAIRAYKAECDNPAKDYVLRAKRRDEMFALLRDHDQEVRND